ncbi:MAG: ribonuclease D [Actinomycetota bacterium]
MSRSQTLLVTQPDELKAVVSRARSAGAVAFDTEFMRERTYRARLCLVQIAFDEEIALVDAAGELDLEPVGTILGDDAVEIFVHSGRQDFEIFYDLFGVVPARAFDVQVAAGFAGHGASLPYGRLVASVLGVQLKKGEAYTDWCRRPLTDAQMTYAADDVRFLGDVAARLRESLSRQGRLVWAEEEMADLCDADTYRSAPGELWRRVSGRGTLSARQTAVLREVAAWREEEAARRDLPRGWVVKDVALVEIARRMPTTIAELRAIRGLGRGQAERIGAGVVGAVARGKAAPGIAPADRPSRELQARARMLSGLADAVVRARCEREGVAAELVATRGELEGVLMEVVSGTLEEDHHRLLAGWRRELAGDAVLDLARGRLGVRVVDHPPYVEEVTLRDHEEGARGNQ